MIKIYFAGSIRGGRDDKALYLSIIRHLQTKAIVLTEHIGDDNLSSSGETSLTDRQIYERDLQWLRESDVVVAEVTTPSLGVGFEIARALDWKKKVICLFRENPGRRLSAMISGCDALQVEYYHNTDEIAVILDSLFPGN